MSASLVDSSIIFSNQKCAFLHKVFIDHTVEYNVYYLTLVGW